MIYDFFSGAGKDTNGISGSALIILEELKSYHQVIIDKKLKLKVILNEMDKDTFNTLLKNIEPFKKRAPYEIVTYNRDFKSLFEDTYPQMLKSKNIPRMVFLDQFGMKYITKEIFKKLTELKRTDFIFFISSWHFKRFSEQEAFKKYIEIKKEKFDSTKSYHCHRVIYEFYKSLINKDSYFLAPFSIKKGMNIYGLIFGTNHPFGIEKFLRVSWKLNEHSGDANFNIDDEKILETGQLSIFEEENKPKKLTIFENQLENKILEKSLKNSKEVYLFAFDQGFLPKHSNKVIKKLMTNKQIKSIKTVSQKIHKLVPENIVLLP